MKKQLPPVGSYIYKTLVHIRDLQDIRLRKSSHIQKLLMRDAPYMSESIASGACARLLEIDFVTAVFTRNKYNRPCRLYTITQEGLDFLDSVENGKQKFKITRPTIRPNSIIINVLRILHELEPSGDVGSAEIGVELLKILPETNDTGVTTALRQLQDKGFVEVLKMHTRVGKKARRIYGTTPAGLEELEKHDATLVDKAA